MPGVEECFDKVETVIQEIPEETCNLEPQKVLNFTRAIQKMTSFYLCLNIIIFNMNISPGLQARH